MDFDIERTQEDNLGGVNSLRYLFIEDIANIPDVLDGAIHHEVELNPGTKWNNVDCTEYTLYFKEPPGEGDHGNFYSSEVSGIIPKDRAELVAIFNKIKNRKVILDLVDNNGERKLVGSKEEPMKITFSRDNKTQPAERNEYRLTFKGDRIDLSPFYNV